MENTSLKNNIPIFIDLSKIEIPEAIEAAGRKWVEYGKNNNYFEFLQDIATYSPTHSTIVRRMSAMIAGGGLESKNPAAAQIIKDLFKFDDLKRVAYDLKVYGFGIYLITMTDTLQDIFKIEHTPVENWRLSKMNEDGEIEGAYFSNNWAEKYKPQNKPVFYPVFDKENPAPVSVLFVKPYQSGKTYYTTPDYSACIPHAQIEKELSQFHLSNIENGFVAGHIINFNNGIPSDTDQRKIERKIRNKFTGTSNAGRIIVSFNQNKEKEATIRAIETDNLHEQFQYVEKYAKENIFIAHNVTSPLLFGIRDKSGLGNNANELKEAWYLLQATVLDDFQSEIINAIKIIFEFLNIESPDLFIDSNKVFEKLLQSEAGANSGKTQLSKVPKKKIERAAKLIDKFISKYGEDENLTDFEIIDIREADYDNEDNFLSNIETLNLSLARVPKSSPAKKSEVDTDLFKVRYKYAPDIIQKDSRIFCKKMIKAGKIYRKEDIIKLKDEPVNPGFGEYGADTYDIWKYKGGAQCKHIWQRVVYLRRNNKKISVNEARRIIVNLPVSERKGAKWEVNPIEVAKRPFDMPKRGWLHPPKWLK